jgi:hypothetical protein
MNYNKPLYQLDSHRAVSKAETLAECDHANRYRIFMKFE